VTAFAILSACDGGPVTKPTNVENTARPADPPDNVSGNYTITITADEGCTSLPDSARTRDYSAFIRSGSQLLTLSGSTFAPSQDGYPGTDWNVVATRITGDHASLWFQDPPIWEGTTADTFVLIDGYADGSFTSPRSELAVSGSITFCPSRDRSYKCLTEAVSCKSTNHRLTLTRQ
jgi:hypothetical protein